MRGANVVISECCCSHLVEDLALNVVVYLLTAFAYFEFVNVKSTISIYFALCLHLFEFVHRFDDLVVCFVLLGLTHAPEAVDAREALVFVDVVLDLLHDLLLAPKIRDYHFLAG